LNQFDFDTQPAIGGGYIARLRTAGDGELKPILRLGGAPVIYTKESDALRDLLTNLCKYVNGHLVRDGEVAGETNAAAEAVFKAPLRQKGKTRQIAVSYKGRGRCGAKRNQDRE
jgi:hypothetical protein